MKEIKLDLENFKNIKKKKKCIYVTNDNITNHINSNDKVLLITENKSQKRTVKRTYEAKNITELKEKLGKKVKYLYPNNIDNNNLVYAIEFKRKINIFIMILLGILLVIFMLLMLNLIKIKISNYNTNKLIEEINTVKENEISYVFVEINPKIVLELEGDKVINKSCLNEDCITTFNDLNLENKNINETIDILYNKAKDSGFDTSNVTISSANPSIEEKVANIEYSTYQNINKEEEKELMNEVIDNTSISNSDNKLNYNEGLLEVYKSDSAYGSIYTCSIENNDLACYIAEDFYQELSRDTISLNEMLLQFDKVIDFMALLDKFNIQYTTSGIEGAGVIGLDKITLDQIYVNGGYRSWGNISISSNSISVDGSGNASTTADGAVIQLDDYDLGEAMLYGYDYHVLPLNKLNLVDCSYNASDVITY